MSNFNSEFKKILKNLEANINDKEALEAAKVEIFNLYNIFFEEVTRLEELANSRVAEIAETNSKLEEQISKIDKRLKDIEKDIYLDEEDEEDYDFSITCPYCNKEFVVDMEELKDEVICPECENTIELDWEHDCSDDDCSCCDHHCHEDEDDM